MNGEGKPPSSTESLGPETLAALGLGPDAPLMRDPKLFVDARFLASLIVELENELGAEAAARALFHVGAAHGVRDARRILGQGFDTDASTPRPLPCASTAVVMQLAPASDAAGHAFEGAWPEAHEAGARLSRCESAHGPTCHLSAGYTSGWLSETHGADVVVVERSCVAAGDEACVFRARERSVWLADDLDLAPLLPRIDRRAILGDGSAEPLSGAPDTSVALDADDDAVHVWGPVMVLPFARPEDAMSTLDVLGRDPGVAGVRVVVVDLRQQPLDPDLGAEVLEAALDTIESWGAETILTGVCTLSEPIVADLAASHLLTQKALPDAVAAAFQIAEAQRHPL